MTSCADWITGCSTGGLSRFTEETARGYAEGGIGAVELAFAERYYGGIDWPDVKKSAEKYGRTLWSLHLPFSDRADPSSPDPEVRAYTLETDRELMYRAREAGVKTVVIHPSAELKGEFVRSERKKYSKEFLGEFAELAEKCGVTVAVENLPRQCLCNTGAETREIITSHPGLRMCFDVNHLLGESHRDFFAQTSKLLHTVHISDYDFINERHWLPGEGKIDWAELIGMLEAADYRGPFMYEVTLFPETTIYRRMLEYSDFRRNHMDLAAGKTPSPIGTPVADPVPFWVLTRPEKKER